MPALLLKYRAFILAAAGLAVLTLFNYDLGMKALGNAGSQFIQMLLIIPPYLFCWDFLMSGYPVKR